MGESSRREGTQSGSLRSQRSIHRSDAVRGVDINTLPPRHRTLGSHVATVKAVEIVAGSVSDGTEPQVVAALIAAGVALVVALLTALLNIRGAGRNSARSAHRVLLGEWLGDLGTQVAGVVATATTYFARVSSGKPPGKWRDRMLTHGKKLMAARGQLRYPLFGLDDAFRDLSRIGGWIQHYHERPADGRTLLEQADKLRQELDDVIAKSYRRGEPPTWTDRRRVEKERGRLRDLWEQRILPRQDSSSEDSDL